MINDISPIVSLQFPEHVIDGAPLLVGFIQTYYEYASIRENSIGKIQNRHLDADIDTALDSVVDKFYSVYCEYIPKNIIFDKRNFVKILSKIYEAKGTEQMLKLMFRVAFSDDIDVVYPGDNMMKVSDGKWYQESFITLTTVLGTLPSSEFILSIVNDIGEFSLNIIRTEYIKAGIYRLYFKSIETVVIQSSQYVNVYSPAGQLLYVGTVTKSPKSIKIVAPGNGWVVGQVITIAGTIKSTILRVTGTDSNRGISSLEILEYGYDHGENSTYIVSPYPNKPTESNVDIHTVISSIDYTIPASPVYIKSHTISIGDFVDVSGEVLTGNIGSETFTQTSESITAIQSHQSGVLSISDWLSSRATLLYEFGDIVKLKGRYLDESSKLSSQESRIQDSRYYQAYSYEISTTKDISDYRSILNLTHPAGTKRFSNIKKEVNYVLNVVPSNTISSDSLYIADIVNDFLETQTFDFTKGIQDTATATDVLEKSFIKYLTDTATLSQVESSTISNEQYNSGTYFLESYCANEYTLNIG